MTPEPAKSIGTAAPVFLVLTLLAWLSMLPLLVSRLARAESLLARRMPHGSALVALAADLVQHAMRIGVEAAPNTVCKLGSTALDIWTTTLDAELRPAPSGHSRPYRRLDEVRRYMIARIEDPDLDIETIATSQNMSVRTLMRLFAIEGDTPMRWLWRIRLTASYRLLADRC